MAVRGDRRLQYRGVVENVNANQVLVAKLVSFGYSENVAEAGHVEDASMTYSKCLSELTAFVRRYQSAGIDCHGTMFVRVIGADADNPILAFDEAGYGAEQPIANIDTPDKGLLQRISLANRSNGVGVLLVNDAPEDAGPAVADPAPI